MKLLKKTIKKILPDALYEYLSIVLYKMGTADQKILKYLAETKGQKKFLIIGIPEHSNIGDHAIAAAEKKFLMYYFPGIDIIEVPIRSFYSSYKKLSQYKDDCVVLLHGGGNLGTLYWICEVMVHVALREFCSQRVIIFPQTIYWEKDNCHTRHLHRYMDTYEQHPDLTVFIRDKSIDFMEKVFNCNKKFTVIGTPDIVLYLNKSEQQYKREKILFCLRSDKEKVIKSAERLKLTSYVQGKYDNVSFTDMVYKTDIPLQCREVVLKNKFKEFSSARLVITDRLHGMIFSAITGTPCIALNNSSQKVEGVYSLWLKKLPYIHFVNTIEEAMEAFDNIGLDAVYKYDPAIFTQYWKKIAQIIGQGI